MSSGWPCPHAAKLGDASRPFRRIISAVRSALGKKASISITPSLRIGGSWIRSRSAGRSSVSLLAHAVSMMLAMSTCSRPDIGSDVMSTSPSSPWTSDSTSSWIDSASSPGGGASDPIRLSGTPVVEPGVYTIISWPERNVAISAAIPQSARPSRHWVAVAVASVPAGTQGEVGRGEIGEGQQQVSHVALRVQHQHRDPLGERLLQDHHPESGLARSGHADDDPVRGEAGRSEADGGLRSGVGGGIDVGADVEAGCTGAAHVPSLARGGDGPCR